MKIKVILFEPYRGLISGWATRYVGIIRELVKTHEVYLFAPGNTLLLKEHFGNAFVCESTCDTKRIPFSGSKYLLSLLAPKKELIFLPEFNFNREFHTVVTNDGKSYDLIIYFSLSAYVQYKCHDKNTPAICDFCDSLYRHFFSSLKNEVNTKKRIVTMLDIKYLYRIKRKFIPRDLTVTVITDTDAHYVKKILRKNKIITVPNGVTFPDIGIDEQYISSKKDSRMILFFGSLDYQPNKDSIAYILDHLWPELVNKYPDLKLVIAGRNPDQGLKTRIKEVKNGILYADVAAPSGLYAKAMFTLMPIHSGGGMKNKILESFACGTPVVTTPEGAIGIAMEHDVHGFIGNSARELLDGAECLINVEDKKYADMVVASRMLAETCSWENIGHRLCEAVDGFVKCHK